MDKRTSRTSRPHVALLVESSRAYGRGVLVGIAKYVREHGPWSISFEEHGLCDDVPEWLKDWKGDGIITRLDNQAMAGVVQRLRVPAVYLRNLPQDINAPCVLTDNAAAARFAFEHLRERGFRHFAFCGYDGADYSDERREAFVKLVEQNGRPCHVFTRPPGSVHESTVEFESEGLTDGERVARWIRELPKPAGLMACNDSRGRQVLDACRAAGVGVPDEVGVLGVDNDEMLCDLSAPPLSSVVPNTERIGVEAAALLDQMMAGQKAWPRTLLVEPKTVVARQSTEVLAVEDRPIAAAARFIREHACEGIDVSDVVEAVALSRSTLERRFAKALGRSPKEEILRVRLNSAKQLLSDTSSSLEFIAEKIGLEHTEYLSRIFKKKTGMTPSQFRARTRAEALAQRRPAAGLNPSRRR
jgi:LacI family transcriptional regulator